MKRVRKQRVRKQRVNFPLHNPASYHVRKEPVLFNDLPGLPVGASSMTIDKRPIKLEDGGIVLRNEISDRSVTDTNELTKFGHCALNRLDEPGIWAERKQIKL